MDAAQTFDFGTHWKCLQICLGPQSSSPLHIFCKVEYESSKDGIFGFWLSGNVGKNWRQSSVISVSETYDIKKVRASELVSK